MYTFAQLEEYLKYTHTYEFSHLKKEDKEKTSEDWFFYLLAFMTLKVKEKPIHYKYLFKCFRYLNNPDSIKEVEDTEKLKKRLNQLKKVLLVEQTKNEEDYEWLNFLNIVSRNIDVVSLQIDFMEKGYTKNKEKVNHLYAFASYLIFEVRDLHYIQELLKTFPEVIHFKNEETTLIEVVLDKYFHVLKNSNSDYLLLYYDKVLHTMITTARKVLPPLEADLLKKCSSFLKSITFIPDEKSEKMKNYIERLISNIENEEFFYTEEKLYQLYNISFSNTPFKEKIFPKKLQTITSFPLEDLREKLVVSIDGANTSLRDDAFSFEELNNGQYLLGIYTPSVADFISLNSVLDKQARKMGRNIYGIPNRITIFPESILEKNFSLDCNKERLSLGCFFLFDHSMQLINKEPIIKRVLIRPNYNLNPNQVAKILVRSKNRGKKKEVYMMLHQMVYFLENRKNREILNGNFGKYYYTVFRKNLVDKIEGAHTKEDIYRIYMNYASSLIHFFKILAGSSVATIVEKQNLPFLYQVNPETVEESILKNGPIAEKEIERYLKNVDSTPHYSTESLEHKEMDACYARWTTPMREYASLVTQRLVIKYFIDHHISSDKDLVSLEKYLQRLCKELNLRNMLNDEFAKIYRQNCKNFNKKR